MKTDSNDTPLEACTGDTPFPWFRTILFTAIGALIGFIVADMSGIGTAKTASCRTCTSLLLAKSAITIPVLGADGETVTNLTYCRPHAPKCDRIVSERLVAARVLADEPNWHYQRTNTGFTEVNFDGSPKNPHVCPTAVILGNRIVTNWTATNINIHAPQ